MGTGPLQQMARLLTVEHSQMKVLALVGAKTIDAVPFDTKLDEISNEIGFSVREFAQFGIESMLATDDGSAGYSGPVTECLEKQLDKTDLDKEEIVIFSCGPEAMLARMAQIAGERNIECQISTERLMACGIGLCQSCAVECKSETGGDFIYKLCCKDGPVFDSKEVIFKPIVNSIKATDETSQ
jgi:dihydroorotate dehydrogenase electron transfer subunit